MRKAQRNAPADSVLSLDRLEDPKKRDLDKDLICKLCKDIVQDPRECSKCQSIFCNDCLTNYQRTHVICPNKCRNWMINAVHKKYVDLLNELQFSCYYVNNGCKKLVTFLDFEHHEATCTHQDKKKKFNLKNRNTVRFQFQKDDRSWEYYDETISDAIEQKYIEDADSVFDIEINDVRYRIDLHDMTQTNFKSKKQRKIFRSVFLVNKIPQRDYFYWRWFDGDQGKNIWNDYDDKNSDLIEEGYLNYLTDSKSDEIKIRNLGKTYLINFDKMRQINEQTNFERKIERVAY